MTARQLSQLLDGLSQEDKRHLFEFLQSEANGITTLPDKAICCSVCGQAEHVVKNGNRDSTQRYLCKKCNKSFVANTNTILERTHKPLETWKKFLECMSHGMSIIKTAEICQINKNTAFGWRHKVLDALSLISGETSLNGIVEADETFSSCLSKGRRKSCREKPKSAVRQPGSVAFPLNKFAFRVPSIEKATLFPRLETLVK